MDEKAVFLALFYAYLSCRLKEWLALDISHRAAYLGNDHIAVPGSSYTVDEFLYLIGYVRYHLHSTSEVFPAPLLVENVPVDLSSGKVREFIEIFINESFVVSEIEICLSTVLRNVYLSVLEWTHRSGIHIDIRVQLLCSPLEAPRLQETSE